VYTPALVVNGAALMVGSDKAAVESGIERSLALPAAVTLGHTPSGLEAEIGAMPVGVTAMLAICDPQHATLVSAGENQGRQLVEYRVVRKTLTLNKPASLLTFPPVPAGSGAVLLIQDAFWRVIGAADLPPKQGA